MLWSLRARLIVSFALVVALAVFLAGAGALFLLRDQEEESARERYGRYAEPVNREVDLRLRAGDTLSSLRQVLRDNADQLEARMLLLDKDLQVVFDTESSLQGEYVLAFENPSLQLVESGGSRYKWTTFHDAGPGLTLFAPPAEATDGPPPNFATPDYDVLIAIPDSELASAWLDLAPRLAIAGGIALAVSFIVSFFISRSISGPLARITQASVQMAQGDYDVYIPIRGQDEVGRLSEAFNGMAREVSRSQRAMKDLLANVSHELKTPLTSIQGFSQAMLEGAISREEEFRESSRIIYAEASRMRELVDDLLLLSQIETGQMQMQHAQVDLSALLDRTLERFQWAFREQGTSARLAVDRLPSVHGDERRLEQVFSNLIENALRHTPRGGVVTVSGVALRSNQVTVGVHNTGSFIPPDDLPRVFERFFQVDRARAGGSSGLGLAIVSEIVEAHGGNVRAISNATNGTEFIVTLPTTAPQEARNGRAAAPLDEAAARRASKKREAPA
ncbi:MAG: HAMP domain-containing sensor histidine kinase [Dehalococcoidia bacterium]